MPSGYSYKVVSGSMGGFLDPPGSAQHKFHVIEIRGGHEMGASSLRSAVNDDSLPADVRLRVRGLLSREVLVCSEAWLRQVYGYFRNCYSPDGVNRNTSDLVNSGPPAYHLAVLMVREFFPDHEPRLDLIADASGGYGQKPCVKCGKMLQYEASVDAWAEPVSAATECPQGGTHNI